MTSLFIKLKTLAKVFLLPGSVWYWITSDGVIRISHQVSVAGFFEPAHPLLLCTFLFIRLCHRRPLGGPNLGVFAREFRQNRFHVFTFGAPKDVSRAGAFTDHRFD